MTRYIELNMIKGHASLMVENELLATYWFSRYEVNDYGEVFFFKGDELIGSAKGEIRVILKSAY